MWYRGTTSEGRKKGYIWQAPSGDQGGLGKCCQPLRALSRGLSRLPDHGAGLVICPPMLLVIVLDFTFHITSAQSRDLSSRLGGERAFCCTK
jgi:hypothetical protein